MSKILILVFLLAGCAQEPVAAAAPADTALYDLSGFDIPYPVTWPAAPVVTKKDYHVAAGNFRDLRAAVQVAKRRVILPDGNYAGDLTSWASDVHVVASDGAVLNGSILINSANRVRWSGGAIESSSGDSGIILRETNDIVFDNTNLTTRNGGIAIRRGGARYAIINTRINLTAKNGWGLHTLRNGSYQDIILANVDFSHNSTGAAFRINREIQRLTIVDSFFAGTHPGRPAGMRFNGVVDGHIENVINIGNIHANYSSVAGEGNPIDITNVSMTNVHVYRDSDYTAEQIALVSSAAGNNPVRNSVHHWGRGARIAIIGFTDAGGNKGMQWDERTIDFSTMPGKASRADYGADH